MTATATTVEAAAPLAATIALLGRAHDPVRWLILCPVHRLYAGLRARIADAFPESHGYMRAFAVAAGSMRLPGDGLVVATPQGPAASDPIYLGLATRVLVLGYAGGLTPAMPIGGIVEATSAVLPDRTLATTAAPVGPFPVARCAWSPSLLGPPARRAVVEARCGDGHVVDMETAYCFVAARAMGADCSALLIVTDIPGHEEFYQIDAADAARVGAAEEALLDFFVPGGSACR